MYVYRQTRPNNEDSFTVGFYTPLGQWNPESDHDNREAAVKRTAYLNGATTSMQQIMIYQKGIDENMVLLRNMFQDIYKKLLPVK